MPVGGGTGNTSQNQSRQTFRPPWVKDGPPPIPMPTQPWVKSNRNFPPNDNKQEAAPVFPKQLRKVSEPSIDKSTVPASSVTPERKTSKITITPSLPKENGAPIESAKKPVEPIKKPVEPAKKPFEPPPKKQPEIFQKPPLKPTDARRPSEVNVPIEKVQSKPPLERQPSKPRVLERSKTSEKYEGLPPGPPKPPAPPMPPAPPPPPPPPGQPKIVSTLTPEKAKKLEMLRARPKKRPDWGNVMKEIESGRKLTHVKCNDRSAPLLPKVKAKGQFVYESERPNLHNQLLKQIETGVRLKPVKTNDRSKPFIEGLRKFRRQMTIEEQIQKSASMASMGIAEVEPDPLDEVDDIDKVRDDLQSTKQLLAMELKNKEAIERENKKLVTKILNLEVELEKEKNKVNKGAPVDSNELQKEIKSLREEAEQAKKLADEMETKYHEIQGQYEIMKLDLDEATQKNQRLEKQLKVAQAANLANLSQGQPLAKQPSKKIVHQNKVHETPVAPESPEESEEEETETETESESEHEGENEEAKKERKLLREIKLFQSKLKSFKAKRETAKKERKSLKEQMSKLQKAIKEEKKKYKVLQKEVDKMSKFINEDDEEEVEDEEEQEEEEEEEEETSEEEEESEESESEESEGDLPESAPPEKKKVNLQGRTKKYENLLSSLKKGNYLLKANVDRYKDELTKQKSMSLTLQEDLNSILAELG